jgi:predicted DCC family thiol-disulfide oxidoreductase YuxK
MAQLEIFYDGGCPLCLAEMRHLKHLDVQKNIKFIDINDNTFPSNYPEIDRASANRILHGRLKDGSIILGLDVTHRAWSLVGRGKWTAILRMPIFKHIADFFYHIFARHRYRISKWLTGQERCQSCSLEARKDQC